MKKLLPLIILITSCTSMRYSTHNTTYPGQLMSINFIDQNGLSETISSPDRLKEYENVNFISNQPYTKVMRVYSRDSNGNIRAYLTTYHPNGQPKQYLEVVNNRAYGAYKEWFPEGHLKLETTIIGGEADLNTAAEKTWLFDGTAHVWDEKQKKLATIPYLKGELNGPSIYFHSNGNLWKRAPYVKGELCGTFETFLESGELFPKTEYVNGQEHGPSTKFWTNGSVAAEELFENGLLVTGHYYDSQGNPLSQIIGGHGERVLFSKTAICEKHQYKNGALNGAVNVFDANEKLIRTYHVKNNQKHGEEIEYFPQTPFNQSLKPMLLITWNEGKIHGTTKTWYDNGQLESQRETANNQKSGLCTAWYRDGSLMLIEEYDQDKLTKGEYFKKGEKDPITEVHTGSGIATLHDAEGNFLHRINYHKGIPDVT